MIKTVTIESVNVKAAKEGIGKNNKPYKLFPIGIKAGGEWLNGAAFSDKDAIIFQNLKNGDKIELDIYEEMWQGKPQKKFKLPTKDDKASAELEQLKTEVTSLKEVVKQLVKHTKLVYVAPKQHAPLTKEQVESISGNNNDDLPF